LLNILQISFAWISSPAIPMILRFGLLMDSVSSYIFLSQIFFCLFLCLFLLKREYKQ
jgi:hypothetical protein